MILVTSDLHLTDSPDDEYRWAVFDAIQHTPADELFILGDLCDRKDRHSAELVNRLVKELLDLQMPVTILKGNHDEPLRGKPFWSFLSELKGMVSFIDTPTKRDEMLFLPYSKNPRHDWQGLTLDAYDVVFLHQPMNGVLGNNGHRLEVKAEPVLPPGPIYYSGDIHTPQTYRGVEYIGAPHPVRFGDNHLCRLLLLDDKDYSIAEQIKLDPPRKDVLEVRDVGELLEMQESGEFLPGDQFRVRVHMPLDVAATEWPAAQAAIAAWGRDSGLRLASIEVLVDRPPPLPGEPVRGLVDPKQLLLDYGKAQELDDALIDLGLKLLEETIG